MHFVHGCCLIVSLLASLPAWAETAGSTRTKPVCGNTENGIVVGKPKLFDDRTLALTADSMAARLAELSSADPKATRTLSEQTQLTFQISNLRALAERSLSDRVLLKASASPRAQAVLGFQVSVDPPRKHPGAVAEIEITVISKGQASPAVVSLLPREKTFNAAQLEKDGSVVKDSDTLALERLSPTHEQVKGCATAYSESEHDVTFAWRFKPVFGSESVDAGTRQVYALLALPSTVNEDYLADVHVHTHWRMPKPGKRKSAGLVEESLRDELWTEAIRYNPAEMERALQPKVKTARFVYAGKDEVHIEVEGESFLPDTAVAIGELTVAGPKLEIERERRMRFSAPVRALMENEAYVSGRFGSSVPLADPRASQDDVTSDPAWGLKIEHARARPKDFEQSEVRIKIKSRQRKKPAADLIVNHTLVDVAGRVQLLTTADTDPTDSDALMIRFDGPTAMLRASPRVTVTRLFGGELFRDSAELTLEDDISASKVNVLAATDEDVTLAVAGAGFSNLAVVQLAGVTYTRWTKPAISISGSSMLELKLKRSLLQGARQITVSQGFAQPVILPLPDLDKVDPAATTEVAKRKSRRRK